MMFPVEKETGLKLGQVHQSARLIREAAVTDKKGGVSPTGSFETLRAGLGWPCHADGV